jgi:phosphoglycolate phosphatase
VTIALLFDIDGTLLNAGGAGQSAMEAALAAEFGATRPVEGIPTAGRTDFGITRDLLAYFDLPDEPAVWERFRAAYFERLPAALAQTVGAVLPGVRELLQLLAARDDVILGLLTGNFATGAWLKLKHFSLDHHFRFGSFGDEHPHRDDVARRAWDQLQEQSPGIAPQHVWVIGDTPADVRCGRAIGARTFAVATGLYSYQELEAESPDRLHQTLADPHEWLDHLFSFSGNDVVPTNPVT